MRCSPVARRLVAFAVLGTVSLSLSTVRGQQPGAANGPETVEAVNEEYDRQLLQLDRQRLERLGRIAARQDPVHAAATYEQLFRLAIAANLFEDAASAAETVVKSGSAARTTVALAHLVKIIAEADRGAHEQSLESLRGAIQKSEKAVPAGEPGAGASLQSSELIGITDAYYQRLVHADQVAIARKALQLCHDHTTNPALKEFIAARLKRLDLVGKPAPPIRANDIDGRPFDLATTRGKVVLIEFWASWCLPSATEVEDFQQAVLAHHGQGLEVVGINLDTLQDGGVKAETALPNIRRFLLDHNVPWPNLVNGTGDTDFAAAYGVTEIPASVLIGRDGKVVQVDLVRKNMESLITRELGR